MGCFRLFSVVFGCFRLFSVFGWLWLGAFGSAGVGFVWAKGKGAFAHAPPLPLGFGVFRLYFVAVADIQPLGDRLLGKVHYIALQGLEIGVEGLFKIVVRLVFAHHFGKCLEAHLPHGV